MYCWFTNCISNIPDFIWIDIIRNITHSISTADVDKLKTLRPGVALCFGNAFNIPIFTKIDNLENRGYNE